LENQVKLLAFAGSLRTASFNKALIKCAVEECPTNISIEVFDLEGIPAYNADLENTPPESVKKFKDKIRAADALLLSTPEYNYSISGVLKNALDWASRPAQGNPLEGKPAAIMSASTGRFGGARAQYHLRQTFVFLNMQPVNRPEVMLSDAANNVDANGRVTNEKTRQQVRQLLESLATWTIRLKSKP
jgi:chromate reductase